jgi:O-antigen/teichoic acid export membrane protein
VRELVNHPQKRDTYLGSAFWLKIIGAFFAIGLMPIILPFTSNDTTTKLYIFIIASGLIFQSFEVVEFYFQSQVLAKIITICKVIQLALSLIIKSYLVLTEAQLVWFVFVILFDYFSLAVSYYIAYKLIKNPSFYKYFNLSIAKKLLKDSWPLIFASIVVSIYMRIDQVMIKEMLGEYEVGIYSAASRLSEAFYFIPMLILSSFFPAILNSKNHNLEIYNQRLQILYTSMVWLGISIALPMTFFSDWLILLIFGQLYQEAGQVLMIHTWTAVFVFIGVVYSGYLTIENKTKKAFYRTLIGAIVNVFLNYMLIPTHGIKGAAIATLIGQFSANYLYDIFDKDVYGQFKMKSKAFFPIHIFLRPTQKD